MAATRMGSCCGLAVALAILSTVESAAFTIVAPKRRLPAQRSFLGQPKSHPRRKTPLATSGVNGDASPADDGKKERDLFEYFDPLLSPHAYPNGIGPENVPDAMEKESSSSEGAAKEEEEEEKDLLDYFDPLRSPHEYPNGIDAAATLSRAADDADEEEDEEEWTPFHLESAANDSVGEEIRPRGGRALNRPIGMEDDRSEPPGAAERSAVAGPSDDRGSEPKPDLFDVFDPRLSPHSYASGIPDHTTYLEESNITYAAFSAPAPSLNAQKIVGILLIDHGSRRGLSNARLQRLARTYESRSPDHYVVRAAHMDIARPSIEDGLRALLDRGVSRIVCHPYFLSPGRHAAQDLPRLIEEAVDVLGRPDVPVVTTDPIGASMDVMLDAIDGLVQATLREMEEDFGTGGKPGGLFGDIQHMMDEQL